MSASSNTPRGDDDVLLDVYRDLMTGALVLVRNWSTNEPYCAQAEQLASQAICRAIAPRSETAGSEIERAYQMLEACGVPRDRAKNLANGIDVLATRFRRDDGFQRMAEADATRYRRLKDAAGRTWDKLAGAHLMGELDSAIDHLGDDE